MNQRPESRVDKRRGYMMLSEFGMIEGFTMTLQRRNRFE